MPIEFHAWVATGSTYVQQKYTQFTQEVANTRDKVLSVAIRIFSFLITAFYSFFFSQPPAPVETDSNNSSEDNALQEATSPPPVVMEVSITRLIAASSQHIHNSSSSSEPQTSISTDISVSIAAVTITSSEQQVASPPPQLNAPPPAVPSNAFLALKITDKEKTALTAFMKKSAEIKPALALSLLPEAERVKKTYKHIHTLRSMAHFITDPTTKEYLRKIMKTYVKRLGYMDDFKQRMNALDKTRDIDPYLPGFCEFVNGDFKQVDSLLREKKYQEFINYLLNLK